MFPLFPRFWKRAGFVPVYLRQTPVSTTLFLSESPALLKSLGMHSSGFCEKGFGAGGFAEDAFKTWFMFIFVLWPDS